VVAISGCVGPACPSSSHLFAQFVTLKSAALETVAGLSMQVEEQHVRLVQYFDQTSSLSGALKQVSQPFLAILFVGLHPANRSNRNEGTEYHAEVAEERDSKHSGGIIHQGLRYTK